MLSNLQRGFPFISLGFRCLHSFKVLKLILLFSILFIYFLFFCSMARGEKETSTNRVRHRRLAPRESPTASILVIAMYVEKLRFFCLIPADISLKLLDGAAVSTVGWAYNIVYFTREQFFAGLRFPISSLMKQFLPGNLMCSYIRTSFRFL